MGRNCIPLTIARSGAASETRGMALVTYARRAGLLEIAGASRGCGRQTWAAGIDTVAPTGTPGTDYRRESSS
jgi:hypothetical protein